MYRKGKFYKSRGLLYSIGRVDEKVLMVEEFKIGVGRNILERVEHSFIKTYKPIMDDIQYRIFDKLKDYKDWCEKCLPSWLGYGKVKCK